MPDKVWEVIGKKGVAVRDGDLPGSRHIGSLAAGALLKEVALEGARWAESGQSLRYERISGDGPDVGCVLPHDGYIDVVVRNFDVLTHTPEPAVPLLEGPCDMVIYGATGFTGSLMVEHLDALLSEAGATRHSWAVAGRDVHKLSAIAGRCKTSPGIIRASLEEGIPQMVSQGKVVVAAAGPYQLVGEAIIKACVETGTHYVDVTGETAWVHEMIEKYGQQAKQKGVVIMHCAGQVCAIDDINCYMLAKKLGPLKQFREYFFQYGAATGGSTNTTITSFASMTPERLKVLKDPFCLGGQRKREVLPQEDDCTQASNDPLYPSLWLQPAYNGPVGSRIIRRTCQLFEEMPTDGVAYGDEILVMIRDCAFSQKAAEQAASGSAVPLESADMATQSASMMKNSVLQGSQPKPGEGPPPETRALYFSDVYGVAEAESGEWAHVHYTGPEGYETTAMACVTAALVLLEELETVRPSERGGSVTPAFALHETSWIERIEAHTFANGSGSKMTFKMKEGKPSEDELKQAIQAKSKAVALGMEKISTGQLRAWSAPVWK